MSKFTIQERLQIARIKLQRQFPFYGFIALQLKLVEQPSVGTAGVDGKGKMYYAPDFIDKLDTDELVWLWAHEIGHLIFDHVIRRGNRNHMVFNMSGDYCINLALEKDNVGKRIENTLLDQKYKDMNVFEVYDLLMKDAEQAMKDYQKAQESGGADSHEMWGKGEDGKELSEEDKQSISKKWQQAAVSAAHAAKAAGKEVPEAFRGLIEDLTEGKIPWRDFVNEKIKAQNKEEQTWSKINPYRQLGQFNAPGYQPGEKVSFLVVTDSSASYTQEMITDAMSEVYGATREFEEVTIDVIQFDTRVYGHKVFTQDNAEEMMLYEIQGGGGTDYQCVHDWLIQNQKQPSQIFCFTDGYFSALPDHGLCDTTFIISEGGVAGPYGESVFYDKM
jgi:predicted metal-dependent peptidase